MKHHFPKPIFVFKSDSVKFNEHLLNILIPDIVIGPGNAKIKNSLFPTLNSQCSKGERSLNMYFQCNMINKMITVLFLSFFGYQLYIYKQFFRD